MKILKHFIIKNNLEYRNHALNYFDWDLVSKKIIYDCEELVKYKNKPLPFQLIPCFTKKLLIKKTLKNLKRSISLYS